MASNSRNMFEKKTKGETTELDMPASRDMRREKRQAQLLYQYQYPTVRYLQPDYQSLSYLYPQYYLQYANTIPGSSYQTRTVLNPNRGPSGEVLVTQYPPSRDEELIQKLYSGGTHPTHLRPFGGRYGDRTDEELLRLEMYDEDTPKSTAAVSYPPGQVLSSQTNGPDDSIQFASGSDQMDRLHSSFGRRSLYKKPGPEWVTSLDRGYTHSPGTTPITYSPGVTTSVPFMPPSTSTPPPMLGPADEWGTPLLSSPPAPFVSHVGRVPSRRPSWPSALTNYHAPEARITSFGHAIIQDNNH
ncbi:hypothetical protein AAG570_010923 [Ranatra chinensis]|uniref:Uncharacterized protein n=1 Tax=Ranatra chinensis TaxID=642074 RepID=A0ABD0YJC7_9HEMI